LTLKLAAVDIVKLGAGVTVTDAVPFTLPLAAVIVNGPPAVVDVYRPVELPI